MSKKVVTFLVVLFAIAGIVIMLAKSGSVSEPPPAGKEVAATTTPTPTSEEGKPVAATEDKPAATADKEATPAAAEDTTGKEDSLLGDEAPLASKEPAKTEDKAEEKKESIAEPAKPIIIPVTPPVEQAKSLLDPSASMDVDMDNALAERAIGDPDAPVVMIEYASMTCPHCARFHNEILPKVKASLIDTGKLRLIFRDYPLDTHALRAAMMARCTDRSRYFNLVEVLFKNQDRWVKSTDPLAGLKQLGALAGMDSSYIEACIKDPQLEQFILSGMQDGQKKYKIKATPTFVFNNDADQLSGDQNPEDFEKMVDKLMKKEK